MTLSRTHRAWLYRSTSVSPFERIKNKEKVKIRNSFSYLQTSIVNLTVKQNKDFTKEDEKNMEYACVDQNIFCIQMMEKDR